MSRRMMDDVLKLRDISIYCPLCGRKFGRNVKTEEHIFPRWLQKHHNLETMRLTLPNFIGKTYNQVKIDICEKCNHKRFGRIENDLSRKFVSGNAFANTQSVDPDLLAVWLGKIFWLLCRKGYDYQDHRTRNDTEPDQIVPRALMQGMTYLAMLLNSFAMQKGMYSCYLTDPPVPEFFYGAPYSLYTVEIDTRDSRFDEFDFMDNLATLSVAIRTGNIGVICCYDGGIHTRFRSQRYTHLLKEKFHPIQFNELVARIFYDQTVMDDEARKVQYYWNDPLKAVIAQTLTPRDYDPFIEENHDPKRQAAMIGRNTYTDPKKILHESGRLFSSLEDENGNFLPFAVTDEEIEEARRDPTRVSFGILESKWRYDPNFYEQEEQQQ